MQVRRQVVVDASRVIEADRRPGIANRKRLSDPHGEEERKGRGHATHHHEASPTGRVADARALHRSRSRDLLPRARGFLQSCTRGLFEVRRARTVSRIRVEQQRTIRDMGRNLRARTTTTTERTRASSPARGVLNRCELLSRARRAPGKKNAQMLAGTQILVPNYL